MKPILTLIPMLVLAPACPAQGIPTERTIGQMEVVATFNGQMPTGVTVANDGRIFVNYPRWGDPVDYTVAELKNGQEVPYPDAAVNRVDMQHQPDSLLCVQSVVVDPTGKRLWLLDTGSVAFAPVTFGGPKLIGIDLKSDHVFKKILLPQDVALPTTYLNDVRFDLRRGKEGMAFITDSSTSGPNGIIVIDLASGKSWRRLHDHLSTKADPHFLGVVEGLVLMLRLPGQKAQPFLAGADGIALSPDGKMLYYCPLSSRYLYRVSVDALTDQQRSDADVAKTVEDLGEKGGASDGLEADMQGSVYLSDYEHDSIRRRRADGTIETIVHDPRILWPDTLSLAADGYLYFTANQLERQPAFNNGEERRQKPYALFRTKVDGQRISQ